jgi:putative membrane protein
MTVSSVPSGVDEENGRPEGVPATSGDHAVLRCLRRLRSPQIGWGGRFRFGRVRRSSYGDAVTRRFPGWIYGHGTEPDPRFTLANERTFLAWIRTSLALVAGGVALEALSLPLQPTLRLCASVLLLLLGLVVPALAWWDWGTTERAMREEEPLPGSRLTLALAVGALLVAGLVLAGLLAGSGR